MWHDGTIPSNEVWVKIGGDKGCGSFKLNMQVVNVTKPNSTRNSCLLAIRSSGLKVPLSTRGHCPPRSLQTLKEDHQRFVNTGANIKSAKLYNNVIEEANFSMPLEKVFCYKW